MDGGTTESAGGGRRTIVEGLGSLEGWWNASGIALWSFVLFGAFLLNATLLLAFLKRPGLRTISNRFVMNLTVSNLLTCAILNPLLMLDGPSSSGSTMCSVAESATALVTSSSVLSVLLIAVDQYLAVVDPLRYRTRIDKLKCGILVISVWLVSLVFAILAAFNPSPRSLWLVCGVRESAYGSPSTANYTPNETMNLTIDASLRVIVNATENYGLEGEFTFTEYDDENSRVDENGTWEVAGPIEVRDGVELGRDNATRLSSHEFAITYGLVYAIVHALLAYLAPFLGVCWIYVSIYSAAHKNSERTRRTGSRPILSSGSFSEEYYPVRQETSSEDFRRIPKISSLSSIDESIETHTPSQAMPRRGSELLSNSSCPTQTNGKATIEEEHEEEEEEQRQVTVVFTVGSSKVDLTQREAASSDDDDDCDEKSKNHAATKDTVINVNNVPIAVLKAQFLDGNGTPSANQPDVKSKFRDEPKQKRKSSHDLMYEEMLRCNLDKLVVDRGSNASTDDEDDDDDDDDDDEEEADDEANESMTIIDAETGVGTRDNPKDACQDAKIVDEKPRESRDDETTQEDHSSRENSLDSSIPNVTSQSSILKTQTVPFNGRTSCRINAPTNWHRNEHQANVICDEHLYGKSAAGNMEAQQDYHDRNTPIVTITPPNRTCLQRVSSIRSTTSYINSLKHRISNGSLFKYREETRAARISALVIVMGLVCWTPYVIVSMMKNVAPIAAESSINHETEVAAVCFVILATYVSPLLFGYRSRRVKRELRKFFCFRRELSYKNNRSLMAKKVLKRRHSGNMSQLEMDARYNIFNCVYGRTRWPKDKVHFVQVPETALVVETCRSSFSSGASTQISSTSTEEC